MPASNADPRQAAAASAAAVAAVSSAAMPAPSSTAAAVSQPASNSIATLPSSLQRPPQQPPAPLAAHLSSMVSGEFRRRLATQTAQQIAQAVMHTERFGSAAQQATARAKQQQQQRASPIPAPLASASQPDALLLLPALLRLAAPPGVPLDFRSLPCLWALDRQKRGAASLHDLENMVARSAQVLSMSGGGSGSRRKVQTPAHAKAILAAQQMQQMYTDLCEIENETAAATAGNPTDATTAEPTRVSFTHWFLSLLVHAHPTASFKHVGLRVLYLHRAALELLWELLRPMLLVAPAAATAAAAAAATNSSSRARQLDASSSSAAAATAGTAPSASPPSASAASSASSSSPPLQLVALDSLLAFSSSFAPCSSSPGTGGGGSLSASIAPAVALGCSSFQSFFNLLQLVSESCGLLDLQDEILDHYIPLIVVERMIQKMEGGIKEAMRAVKGETKKKPAAAAAATAAPVVGKQSKEATASSPLNADASDAPLFIIHTDLELVNSGTTGPFGSGSSTQQGSSSAFVTPRPLSGRAPSAAIGTPSPPKQHRPLQHQSSLLALPLSLSLGLGLGMGAGGPGGSPELGSFRGSGASSAQVSERGGTAPAAVAPSVPVMTNSHRGSVMQPLLRNIAEEAGSGGGAGGAGGAGGMVHSSSNSMLQQMLVDTEQHDNNETDELAQTGGGGGDNFGGSPSHAESARVRGAAASGDMDDLDQLPRRPLHEIPLIDWGAQQRRGGSGSARAGSADDLLTPTSSARPLGSAPTTAPRRHPGVPSLSFGHAGRTGGPASDQPLSGHIGHTRDLSSSAGRLANGAAWPASSVTSPLLMAGHSHSSSVPSMPLSAASTTLGPHSNSSSSLAGRNHLGDSGSSGVSSAGTSLAQTPLTSPTGASYAAHLRALNPRRSTNPTARSSYGHGGMDFLSALQHTNNSSSLSSLNNSTRGVPASAKGVVPSLALHGLSSTSRGSDGSGTGSPQKSAGLTYTQRMQHGLLHSPHAQQQQQQQHLIVGAMTYGSPIRSPSFPSGLPSPYLASQRSPQFPLMTPHRTQAPESSRFMNMGPRNAELDGPMPSSHAALLSSASKLVGGTASAAAVAGTGGSGGGGAELAWPHHHVVHDIDLLSDQQVQQLINDGGDGDGDGDGGDDSDAGFGSSGGVDVAAGSDDEDDPDADADADADDADLSLVDDEELSPAHAHAQTNTINFTESLAVAAATKDSQARSKVTATATAPASASSTLVKRKPSTTKIVIDSPSVVGVVGAKAASKPSTTTTITSSSASSKPTSPEVVELHRKPSSSSKVGAKGAATAAAKSSAAGVKAKSPTLSRQSSTAGLASASASTATTATAPERKKGVTFRPSLSKGKSGAGGGASITPPSTAAAPASPAASAAAAPAPASAKPALTLMISNTLPVRGAITTPTAATSASSGSAFNLAAPSSSSSNVHPFGATHSPDGKVNTEPFATQLAKASSASSPADQLIPRA